MCHIVNERRILDGVWESSGFTTCATLGIASLGAGLLCNLPLESALFSDVLHTLHVLCLFHQTVYVRNDMVVTVTY